MTTTRSGEMTPTQTVTALLAALEDLDVDAALTFCSPDVVYQNVPLKPARGQREVGKVLRSMMKFANGFRVDYINLAANGPVVLTERTDVISAGPVAAGFWVCGTFEVHDGLITLWRDRFDWVDFTTSFVRGGVKAVVRKVRPG
ncbi:MAG: limonene-1,2-epoxide hydrolase family protein [Acidimicrobiales bacterium]|jgi:limonene-1,2-epoxide hydrolase